MAHQDTLLPFLKWAGGKRWFVQKHADLLPRTFNRYIEPFLGGGSIFFHLQPSHALLGDTNPDVIFAYQGIKEDWKSLVKDLRAHERNHSDEYYYRLRESQPDQTIPLASRMIYLNRTCFNGIYRVNKQGQFNVPRGNRDSVFFETDNFCKTAAALKNAEIRLADFEELIEEAKRDDLIFADPPYTVRHNLNGFIKYNEKLFSWDDQKRLTAALIRAKERGVKIVSTNASHSSVRELYEKSGFTLITTSRFSSISASAASRKQFEELVIISHPKRRHAESVETSC